MISLVELFTISGLATLTVAAASHSLNLLRQSGGGRTEIPARCNIEESGRPSKGAWHTPRQSRRHRVSCRVDYVVSDRRASGTVVDMSREGWRVRGEQPVAKNTTMTLHVYLSDLPIPVPIDKAIVRWADGVEFGIELTSISPKAAGILSDYLTAHFPTPQPTPIYALSPFSYN